MHLYNTFTRKIDKFTPTESPNVGFYACGITAYDLTHIGHGKKYIGDDLLRRSLEYLDYRVNHVQNVTDVGHLVSDADEGEDKVEKGAHKYGKTPEEVTTKFAKHFYDSMDAFNVLRPHTTCWASKHIKEQVAMIKEIEEKGYAYDTPEALYFDVSKMKDYAGIFQRGALSAKRVAVREGVKSGKYKKHPADFALWFKLVGRFKNHAMHWPSPWGEGFPGWHIECSAMSIKYLGKRIDIHSGGEDHIATHHPNEVAQNEAAVGRRVVNFWVHHMFLKIDGKKMSKSIGNLYTVEDIKARGYDPLAFRYLCLQAHYRRPLNFTWQALGSSAKALVKLRQFVGQHHQGSAAVPEVKDSPFYQEFVAALENDLNVPAALSVAWDVVASVQAGKLGGSEAVGFLLSFDQVLGLDLDQESAGPVKIPAKVRSLVKEREQARANKDFKQSDKIRDTIKKMGFVVEDSSEGPKVKLDPHPD